MSQTVTLLRRLQLPPEVIGRVLDDLGLKDILSASHVSRTWRTEARAHPTYCGNIDLDCRSMLDSNIQFFLDRLSAKPGKLIRLMIFLVGSLDIPGQVIRNVVLPEVKSCLHRLVSLDVAIYDIFVPDLFAAMTGPAPELKSLALTGHQDSRETFRIAQPLPLGLFNGHAPKLVDLDFSSFRLPPTPIAAFANVRTITYTIHVEDMDAARELHPERFFISCPVLEELNIWTNAEDITEASWDACPPPHVINLRRLYLTVVDDASHTEVVVRALSHVGMESVRVDTTDVNGDTLGLLLSQLDDSPQLQLDIIGNEDLYTLYCTFYDASRARSRTLLHSLDPDGALTREIIEEHMPALLPEFAMTAHRVVRLALSDHDVAWNFFLSIFPETTLAGIETLSLTLCRETVMDIELDGVMRLPSLRCVELVGLSEDVEFEVGEVAYLMGGLLGCVARRELEMQLKGVTIVGDLRRVWGYFKRITVMPCI